MCENFVQSISTTEYGKTLYSACLLLSAKKLCTIHIYYRVWDNCVKSVFSIECMNMCTVSIYYRVLENFVQSIFIAEYGKTLYYPYLLQSVWKLCTVLIFYRVWENCTVSVYYRMWKNLLQSIFTIECVKTVYGPYFYRVWETFVQ